MARKNDVIIQDPPMEEFGKRHSCIKRTCLSGCGCVLLFFLGILFVVHFASQERTKELKEIPKSVVSSVPLYDAQNIRTIQFTNAQEKNIAIEIAGFIPKIILSPFVIGFPEKFIENDNTEASSTHFENIKTFLQRPLEDKKDTIFLEWTNLSADPKFVAEYYKNELKKQNFQIEETHINTYFTKIIFKKEDIRGILSIQDQSPTKEGTDSVSITIHMHVNK